MVFKHYKRLSEAVSLGINRGHCHFQICPISSQSNVIGTVNCNDSVGLPWGYLLQLHPSQTHGKIDNFHIVDVAGSQSMLINYDFQKRIGIVIDISKMQPEKPNKSMFVTESRRVTDVGSLQSSKAQSLISVIELGVLIATKLNDSKERRVNPKKGRRGC